jgi:H+/Cl- antiporter ClcA
MNKRKPYPRFIFTQISGVIVGLVVAFIAVYLSYTRMKYIFESNNDHFPLFPVMLVSIAFVVTVIGSMKLWGLLLVKTGILSKEEAKGYPYSKPWEKDDNSLKLN